MAAEPRHGGIDRRRRRPLIAAADPRAGWPRSVPARGAGARPGRGAPGRLRAGFVAGVVALAAAGCAGSHAVPVPPVTMGGTMQPADAAAFRDAEWARAADDRALLAEIGAHAPAAEGAGDAGIVSAPPLDSLRLQIAPDRALLVYRLGSPHTSLWAITREGWRRFELPDRVAIEAYLDTLIGSVSRHDLSVSVQAQHAMRRLYMMLVASAEPMLRQKRELAIVPDGALWLLPFETLLAMEPGDRGRVPKHGYLVERWSVAYAPSAEAGVATPPRGILGGVLALGDPLYEKPGGPPDGAPVPPLPKTAVELAALDQQARGHERRALVGARATRHDLILDPLLADAGVVHLATHAVATDDQPERSGLWLAAANDSGPGHLRVNEIAALRLRARLVTLSQCETSDPGPRAGRGMRALAGAFFTAGAQQVMLSHWKPIDRTTGALLDRFYRDYLRKGRTAPEALAEAKRQMLKKSETRAPFLWAPLVVIEGTAGER